MPDLETRQLDELTIDETIDPRLKERSQERIEDYADNIDGLPPILVDENNRILDGIHRYHAHRLMGRDRIEVQVVEPDSQLDALTHAIKANAIHGLGLSSEELKRDAIRLWESGATEEHIANTISRSVGTVQSYLAEAKQRLIDKQKREVVNLCKDGHGQKQISKIISENSRRTINQKTVSNYLKEHRKEQVGVLHEQGLTKQEIKNKLKEAFPRNTSDPVDLWHEEYIASTLESDPEPEPASQTEHNQQVSAATEPNHKDILKMLLWIGEMDGLRLWLGKMERRLQFTDDDLAEFPNLLSDLPPQNYENIREVIEDIDVLWLDREQIVAAFEVEHTTPFYTGYLRMSDLREIRSSVRLYVVSPHNRRRKAVREIDRPTFKAINLRKDCQYIPYDVLIKTYEKAKLIGSISDDWQGLLDDISQDL